MIVEVCLFAVFGVLLGLVTWWSWKQRRQAERQAELDAQLAVLGRDVQALAHDLGNLLTAVGPNLRTVREGGALTPILVDDMERATDAALTLLDAMRGKKRDVSEPASAEGVVRFLVAITKPQFRKLDLRVSGDISFTGTDADAMRVVQNLLVNAIREATQIPGATVLIELDDDALRISNPVRDPSMLDDRIYDARVSHSGSSGLGLANARETARAIGWTLRHEVLGPRVAFILEAVAEHEPSAH